MSNPLRPGERCRFAFGGVALLILILALHLGSPTASAQSSESSLLEVGKTIQRELAPTQKHSYKIEIPANQFLNIKVEQQGLDVALNLFAPGGEKVFELDSPNGRDGLEDLRVALSVPGVYLLEVCAEEKGAPAGRYVATLVELRAATPADFKDSRATMDFNEGLRLQNLRTATALHQALSKLSEAEQLRVELGDKPGQIEVIKYTAITYQILGQQKSAIETYQRGIPLAKETGDVKNEGVIYNNLGFIYFKLDDYQNALYYMRLGLETLLQGNQEKSAAQPMINIAVTYSRLGEQQKAIDYYSRAQIIARKYQLRTLEAYTVKDLAGVYSDQGDHQRAVTMLLAVLPVLREQNESSRILSCLNSIGAEYVVLGNDQKALEYFNEELQTSIATRNSFYEALAYYGLAKVYDRQADLTKAIDTFRKALAILELLQGPRGVAVALTALAETEFKAGRYSAAETDMRRAIELIESVRNRISTQDLRTSFFSQDNREIYESYIALLMGLHKQATAKGYEKEAFAASEKARARSLLESLAVARAEIRQGIDPGLLQREKTLGSNVNNKAAQLSRLLLAGAAPDKIAAAKSDYASSEEELQQVEAEIRKASPRYAALTQAQTVSLAEAQTLMDQDSALLEYSLGKDRSFLWVVTHDSLKVFELPKRSEIDQASRKVYELLTGRNQNIKFETLGEKRARLTKTDLELSQATAALSQMVLAPAADWLARKKVLIVPDGGLFYVPFAILPVAKPSSAKGRPLIFDHEVVNLPSASALGFLRSELAGRKPAPRAIAIFADPVFSKEDERYQSVAAKQKSSTPAAALIAKTRSVEAAEMSDLTRAATEVNGERGGASLPRLPFTRQEATAIAAIASAEQSMSLLDFSATRSTALSSELSQYRIIHFATHSFISNAHPEVSGVVLSLIDENGNDRDGFIRSSDVYNLRLAADLIVLSGCRTGLGKEIRGEGLVGMTQSFMYAGAARVLVSLWDVQDEATAELMKRFYRGLLAEKLSPAAALRAAQVSMAQDRRWSAPYYWAGFTLQGEPR